MFVFADDCKDTLYLLSADDCKDTLYSLFADGCKDSSLYCLLMSLRIIVCNCRCSQIKFNRSQVDDLFLENLGCYKRSLLSMCVEITPFCKI